MKHASTRFWKWGLPVALVTIAIAVWWLWRTSRPVVAVFVVDKADVVATVARRGVTRLPREWEITMPATARLAPLDVEVGQPVRKGEVVARLVTKDVELTVRRAEKAVAELEAAWKEAAHEQVELDLKRQAQLSADAMKRIADAAEVRTRESKEALVAIRRILERTRKLAAEEVRSEDELDRVEIDFVRFHSQYEQDQRTEQALRLLQQATDLLPTVVDHYLQRRKLSAERVRRQRDVAQAELEQARLLLERSTMKSPVDGVVLWRATTSEKVVPEGAVLLRIGNLDSLEARVDVLTEEALRIREGAPVEIFTEQRSNDQGLVLSGRVHRIDPEGFTKRSSLGIEQQRVWVIIRFDDASRERLREASIGVGYRIWARIETGRSSQVLRVPRTALFRSAEGTWEVWQVVRGKLRRTRVTLGIANDRWAEIRGGLEKGAQVVVAPQAELEPGQRVQVRIIEAARIDPRSRAQGTTATRR